MPALVAAILLLAKAKDKDKDNDNDNYKHLAHHTGSYQG
jgi:hypothetical protein